MVYATAFWRKTNTCISFFDQPPDEMDAQSQFDNALVPAWTSSFDKQLEVDLKSIDENLVHFKHEFRQHEIFETCRR